MALFGKSAADRIADALEDLVKLQAASLAGRTRIDGLKSLQAPETVYEDEVVTYVDDEADAKREKEELRQKRFRPLRG